MKKLFRKLSCILHNHKVQVGMAEICICGKYKLDWVIHSKPITEKEMKEVEAFLGSTYTKETEV